jgi:hypothetical protein
MLKGFGAVTVLLAATTLLSTVDAISKISRSGRYLYSNDGSRFYIKGIAYQEQGVRMCCLQTIFSPTPFHPSKAPSFLVLTIPLANLRASLTL